MGALKVIDVPELMIFWAEAENKAEDLLPEQIHANASTPCWWRCKEGHLTQRLAISKKVNPLCSLCGHHKLASKIEDSLLTLHPDLAKEWDEARNEFTPAQMTPGSGRMAYWLCSNNHSWQAKVGSRVKRGLTCPYCSHRKVLTGFNDLATMRPDLLKEWDDEELDPTQVKFNTKQTVHWKCGEGHQWLAPINNRTRNGLRKGSNCGQCSKRVSRGEKEVADFVESLGVTIIRSSRKIISPYELDLASSDLSFAVEFNGIYWHANEQIQEAHGVTAHEYHSLKKDLCESAGLVLAYVWQDDWENSQDKVKSALRAFVSTGVLSDILTRLENKEK